MFDPLERIKQLEWQLELLTADHSLALRQLEFFVTAAQENRVPDVRQVNGYLYYRPTKNVSR